MDLLDLWRGRLSLRRIGVLVASLCRKPGRSTLLAAMDGSTAWDTSEHLLARISDGIELSNFLFIQANSAEETGLEPPTPLPRPGQPEPEPERVDFASGTEVASFFTQMNNL
ncbi:hypothetical protein [Streptomyces sp. G1]|uniref:hypothetical protein n=1 Tax=Streptomyces sp. G1 TaxID=361572 RepID=UPI00202EA866|nr:hypothetical protein [Streptomyces sp. G1]MCM1967793.1 hypothetical protein [Streptomyces sp. G1]